MTKEEKDFYLLACRWLETDSVNTVKKYWDAFVEVVVHEVFVKGFCYMPSIGTIHTKTRQGYQEKIKNDDGGYDVYDVPPYSMPYLSAEDGFINDVNMFGVTTTYRKRYKKKKLSQRDINRIARAETYKLMSNISEEDKRRSRKEFQEYLRKKQEEFKAKEQPPNEEK